MSSFDDELQAFVGALAEPPVASLDPVNQPMIRHWCEAVGDRNPIYGRPDLASASSHGSIVAPPTMIQAWFFPPMGSIRPTPGTRIAELVGAFREAGFSSVVATNCEQQYTRYARLGERLTLTTYIDAITGRKSTSLGPGHFVTTRSIVEGPDGDLLVRILYRRLYFAPLKA